MGELIQIRQFARSREIRTGRARDRESLARAVEIMKLNLHQVTRELLSAPLAEHPELMERAENLLHMIRYGLHMMGHPVDAETANLARK